LLVVISLISLLMAIALPALGSARERARYARWQGFSHGLRADPDLVAYYNLEQETGGTVLRNMAAGDAMDRSYIPERLDGNVDASGWAVAWTTEGRWTGKPALDFRRALIAPGVEIPSQKAIEGMQEVSVVVWLMAEDRPSNWGYVVDKWSLGGPGVDNRCWSLNFRRDKIEWRVAGVEDKKKKKKKPKIKTSTSSHDVSDLWGQWIQVVGTYDGSELKLYINGKLEDTKSLPNIQETDQPIYIGAGPGGSLFPFNGSIDEVAIFKRALTDTEVRQHYQMGQP